MNNLLKLPNICYNKHIENVLQEGLFMEMTYKKLNTSKLTQRNRKTVFTFNALKNATPMQWKDTVYNGTAKVIISKQGINYV